MSKIKLCKQAENLYIKGGLSVDEICQNIDIAHLYFLLEEKIQVG